MVRGYALRAKSFYTDLKPRYQIEFHIHDFVSLEMAKREGFHDGKPSLSVMSEADYSADFARGDA